MIAHFREVSERAKAQIAENQQHQENMLASVLKCLMMGDHAGASEYGEQACSWDNENLNKALNYLYKYAPEPEKCSVCGNPIPWEVNDNFKYWSMKCQHCKYSEMMLNKVNELPNLMRLGGVPERFRNALIEEFSDSYRKLDVNQGHFLYGSPGTGKTHLMAAMFRKTVLEMKPRMVVGLESSRIPRRTPTYLDFHYPNGINGVSDSDFPVFISVPELLVKIKSTFNQHDSLTEKDIIDKYSDSKVLFLDDLGAEYSTEWATGVMFLLIDRRYNLKLVTHITSNLSLEELSGKLNDRVTSRIAGMCKVVKMTGKDRRF